MTPPHRDLSGSRLAIVRELKDGSMTAGALGEALDRETGSIFGVVKRMLRDDLLLADTGVPTRGTRYSLTEKARDLLARVERESTPTGLVRSGQRLLLVKGATRIAELQRVFDRETASGAIAWAAEVGDGWLIAVGADSSYPTQRLALALEKAGAEGAPLLVGDVVGGDELGDRAAWLLEDVGRQR